mgnify:CR=1 FL=1
MHQYYAPRGPHFVGDCVPLWHDGVFHLYWLLDEGHHSARGGLGLHQWVHNSSRDRVHWEDRPLALLIAHDWEGSNCTGSVSHHGGVLPALYATRYPDCTQRLCAASSPDGVHFTKSSDNPLMSPPPGYDPPHFRDPMCFQDPATACFPSARTVRWSCAAWRYGPWRRPRRGHRRRRGHD